MQRSAERAGAMSSLVWLTVALPLLGFLVNGALALRRPGAKNAGLDRGRRGAARRVRGRRSASSSSCWRHPPHAPSS